MSAKSPAQPAQTAVVVAPSPFARLLVRMAGMAVMNATERKTSGEDLNSILEASEEDFWDSDEKQPINAKTLSGCIIQINGYRVLFGEGAIGDDDITSPFIDPNTNRQMYLMVESTIIDKRGQDKMYVLPDEHVTFEWNTSARYIVAKIFRMTDFGWFDNGKPPVRVLIKGTPIKNGKQKVEKLKSPDGAPLSVSYLTPDSPEPDEAPF